MVSAATASEADGTALHAAATQPLTISCDESLEHAAQAMSEHAVSHFVVSTGPAAIGSECCQRLTSPPYVPMVDRTRERILSR